MSVRWSPIVQALRAAVPVAANLAADAVQAIKRRRAKQKRKRKSRAKAAKKAAASA